MGMLMYMIVLPWMDSLMCIARCLWELVLKKYALKWDLQEKPRMNMPLSLTKEQEKLKKKDFSIGK